MKVLTFLNIISCWPKHFKLVLDSQFFCPLLCSMSIKNTLVRNYICNMKVKLLVRNPKIKEKFSAIVAIFCLNVVNNRFNSYKSDTTGAKLIIFIFIIQYFFKVITIFITKIYIINITTS